MGRGAGLQGIAMTTVPHASDAGSRIDLSRQFLLAMPGMVSGELANTVIYVCEHTEHGALGLVINRWSSTRSGGRRWMVSVPAVSWTWMAVATEPACAPRPAQMTASIGR